MVTICLEKHSELGKVVPNVSSFSTREMLTFDLAKNGSGFLGVKIVCPCSEVIFKVKLTAGAGM